MPQTSPDQRGSVDGEAEGGPRCSPSSAATVALLEPSEAGRCAVAVELDADVLVLRDLGASAAAGSDAGSDPGLARGRQPGACATDLSLCTIEGRVDPELGPVLLLAQRGPESEMPVQVYLGWVEDGRLGFVETWYGLPSVADHTRIGPPWALAPHICGEGELVLAPAPRLPEAEVEEPSQTLRALAGAWTIASDGEVQAPASQGQGASVSGCRPVFAALP